MTLLALNRTGGFEVRSERRDDCCFKLSCCGVDAEFCSSGDSDFGEDDGSDFGEGGRAGID